MSTTSSPPGSPAGTAKKGDLFVTIVAARNLRSDGKAESSYCVLDVNGKPHKTSTQKDKREPVWNETFNLDLTSLDGAELLISVFGKRRITADKFLGQIQIPIKALTLPKDENWYYLSDRPQFGAGSLSAETPTKHVRKASVSSKRKNSRSDDEDRGDKSYITGELSVKLDFVHRLMRGKSKVQMITKDDESDTSSIASSSSSIVFSPPVSPVATAPPTPSPRAVTFLDVNGGGGSKHPTLEKPPEPAKDEPVRDAELTKNEAIIIDNALKEKQRLVQIRLEEKRELIRIMTAKVNASTEGAQRESEKEKLEEMQNELRELERIEREVIGLLDSRSQIFSKDGVIARPEYARSSSAARMAAAHIPGNKRQSFRGGDVRERRLTNNRMNSMPKFELLGIPEGERFDNVHEEVRYWKMRVKMLDTELEQEKKLVEMANTKSTLLEKENKRLEADVARLEGELSGGGGGRGGGGARMTQEQRWEAVDMLQQKDIELDAVQNIQKEIVLATRDSKESIEARKKDVEEKLKEVELDIEDNIMKQKQIEVELMERRLQKRQGFLSRMEGRSKRAQERVEDGEDDEGDLDSMDSEDSADYDASPDMSDSSGRRPKSPKLSGENDKFDMLVVKLEKLDKLDELLRKIDAMKYVTAGEISGGGTASGRGYKELKQELDDLQKIIFDEKDAYGEKEKEDANIKYEKIFGELAQTSEYKMEQAQALDEKRKMNEPLNKDALDKMLKVFTQDNIRNDPVVKDKVAKNPELALIGMDPKAILAKHQNDFSQYLLRITEIEELRAIRASLPKFRSDQKRQLEWVEVLENKIEQVAKNPPKKAPPPKPPTAKTWKPKPVPKGGKSTDMFAELLAKRNKLDSDGTFEERKVVEEKKVEAPSKIKLAPMKSSTATSTPPPPPSMSAPPPPPPPPPSLQF